MASAFGPAAVDPRRRAVPARRAVGRTKGLGHVTGKEKKHGINTTYNFDPRAYRCTTYLASQQGLGILSKQRTRIDHCDFDHPVAPWADLKRFQNKRNHYELG